MKYLVYFIIAFCCFHPRAYTQGLTPISNIKYEIRIQANQSRISCKLSLENSVQISGLLLNKEYQLSLVTESVKTPSFEILDQNGRKINQDNYAQFRATKADMRFIIKFPKGSDPEQFGYLSALPIDYDQPQLTEIVNSRAPKISTNSNINIDTLIADYFIKGNCVSVSNVKFSGKSTQRGTFKNGGTSIGISEGVIMATGGITVATGPNNASGASVNGGYDNTNDIDLAKLVSQDQNNVAVLEFDFIPDNDTISFEYVFASEEYCDFVDSKYNDVFGFFLSGPGINGTFSNGGKNIALVPSSTEFVSINNINHKKNSTYYNGNRAPGQSSTDPDCLGHPFKAAAAASLADCQFDGYTTPLIATSVVIPCETYHIKLAIADIADGLYDSGVFFKLNSFSAGDGSSAKVVYNGSNKDSGVEGCTDVFVVLTKPSNYAGLPFDFGFSHNSVSTATEGLDYENFPLTYLIPADKDTIQLHINILEDLITEGNETIVLNLLGGCICNPTLLVLNIVDRPELFVAIEGDSICEGQTVTLSPTISGGFPPYTYKWSTNETTESIVVSPIDISSYSVTVTEGCNQLKADTAVLVVAPTFYAEVLGDTVICAAVIDEAQIQIQFSEFGPYEFTILKDGVFYGQISTGQNPYILNVNEIGDYTITAITNSQSLCEGFSIGNALISLSNITLDYNAEPFACPEKPGKIDLNVSGGIPNYQYNWSNGLGNTEDLTGVASGNYTVTVTDDKGCTSILSVEVPAIPPMLFDFQAIKPQNCIANASAMISVSGGTPQYAYLWSNDSLGADLNNVPAGYYVCSVTDVNGCKIVSALNLGYDTIKPLAITEPFYYIPCNATTTQLDGSGSSAWSNISYNWSGNNSGIVSDPHVINPVINQEGNYQLIVLDTFNGCSDTAYTEVLRDTLIAKILASSAICVGEFGTINIGDINGGSPPYQSALNQSSLTESLTYTNLNPGEYKLTVKDALGCTYVESVILDIPVEIKVELEGIDTIQLGESIQLHGTVDIPIDEIDTIIWTPNNGMSCSNCLNPLVGPLVNTEYTLTVTDKNGCSASAVFRVRIKGPSIFIPNMFSPNGDGQNDMITVFANPSGIKQIRDFMIFDRWGEMVFRNSNFAPNELSFGWDGMFKGRPLNPAVFVWWVEAELVNGDKIFNKGSVTLIR